MDNVQRLLVRMLLSIMKCKLTALESICLLRELTDSRFILGLMVFKSCID